MEEVEYDFNESSSENRGKQSEKKTSRHMEISGSSEGQRNLVKSLIFFYEAI